MSFSGYATIPAGTHVGDVKYLVFAIECTGNDDCPDEKATATVIAKQAVFDVIAGGALGAVEETGWNVSISGHVNPGNRKREGWSADSLSINVSQIVP